MGGQAQGGGELRDDAEELAKVAQELGLDDPLSGRILSVRTRVLAAAFRTAPPSAPVGVEDVEVLKRLRAALPDVGLNGWSLGAEVLDRVIDVLAQQPAAVDGAK